jgi:repressor LexA
MRTIVLYSALAMQQLDISSYLGKLQDYYAQERIIPSTTQLSVLWNGKARSWTHRIVQRLKEEGFLENGPGGRLRPGPRFFERTVGHRIRAGLPQEAFDVQPELLRIDDYLIEKPSQTILFPVKGDSMIDLGILEGDMVVIERSDSASPGQVVLAIVDNEFTLKVLARDKEGYYLEARNDRRSGDYLPIRPEQKLEIYGFYVGLFRKAPASRNRIGSSRG